MGPWTRQASATRKRNNDYAIQTRKPVIAFLHADPGMLPRDKTETDDAAWKKLEAFRAKVEKKHTRVSWTSGRGSQIEGHRPASQAR